MDDFEKPYRKVLAVEEKLTEDSLLSLYVDCYKRKFKSEPIFPVSRAHVTQIKDLRRTVGEKAFEIIQTYFKMSDPWFDKQHFSLTCLMQNLSKVNAQVAKHQQVRNLKDKLELEFFCDSCWKPFKLMCAFDFNFLDSPVKCPECKAMNAPLRRVDPKNRRATIQKIGSAFPELPIYEDEPA